MRARSSWDASEDRRSSFAVADEAALRQIDAPLYVTAHLAPDDPRLADLESGVLRKLRRTLPSVHVDYAARGSTGLFEGSAAHYGEVWYRLNGREAMTRSTTVPIVLETIYGLAGIAPPTAGAGGRVSGVSARRSHSARRVRYSTWLWPLAVLWCGGRRVCNVAVDASGRSIASSHRMPNVHLSRLVARAACERRRSPSLQAQAASGSARSIRVDVARDKVGAEPSTFVPMVGNWVVADEEGKKVVMVDGREWKRGQPAGGLADKARAIYGARHEEFIDNVKAFAYFPIAVAKGIDDFQNGEISVRFMMVGGTLDRCAGILFNVKPNGDYLTVRFNGTEDNVVLWTFNEGKRSFVKRAPENVPLELGTWHELKIAVHGTQLQGFLDGKAMLDYTLKEPVSGKVGLWSKTDSMTEFADFTVTPAARSDAHRVCSTIATRDCRRSWLVGAASLAAQASRACAALDTTAQVVREAASSGPTTRSHAWSNDSLRTALVHAAAPRRQP